MNRARYLVWAGSLAVAFGLAGVGLTSAAVSWASDSGAGATSESTQTPGGSSSDEGTPSGGGSTTGGTDSADPDDGPAGGSGAESDADDRPRSSESAADEIGDDELTDAIDDADAIDEPAEVEGDPAAEVDDDRSADGSADADAAARIEQLLDDDHPSEAATDSTDSAAAPGTIEEEPSPTAATVPRFPTDEAEALAAAAATAGETAVAAATASPVSPAASAATSTRSTATVQSWFQRTFFAASPKFPTQTVSVQIDPADPRPTGLVLMSAAETANGRPLTYTVGRAAGSGGTAGTLRISDGSATYTPPPGWDSAPHTDTFSVTASDADGGFHIHGLAGLIHRLTFGLFGASGHSVTSTVTVNVAAAATEPEPPPPPPPPGVPVPAGSFPVSVNNNTGTYRDDEVHLFVVGLTSPGQWAWIDRDGTAHSLDHTAANAPGHLEKNGVNYADMAFTVAEADNLRIPPELLGGRIYLSLGAPLYIAISPDDNGWASPDPANPADPNYRTVYDWYELSFKNGSVPFGGNTTQVDQFALPFTFTVTQEASGLRGTRGIALTRDEVFGRFTDTVPAAFQALVINDIDGTPIRILAPRSQQPGDLATWFEQPIEVFWTKYRTEQFVYAGPGYTVTGGIGADDRFAYTVSTPGGAFTTHTMDRPTTAEVFRADGPFTGVALQGAFLAELNAAFNRGVATSPGDWNDASGYYPTGQRWNNWAQFFHGNSVQGYAYGFPYDDVNSQSSVLILANSEPLTDLTLTLGAQRQ